VVTAQGFAYMVGGLTAAARRAAAASATTNAPEPAAEAALAAAAGPQTPAKAKRRRRAKVDMLGRGFEYMDLEPEPTVMPSDTGAGPFGFAGTAANESATTAAGLASLPDDEFGGGPRLPMMPGTWNAD
jgi:hypothetical protein